MNNIHDMNNKHDMNNGHDNYVNNIAECNLLHDILNTSKCVEIKKYHCSPILHIFMNTRRGKAWRIFYGHY